MRLGSPCLTPAAEPRMSVSTLCAQDIRARPRRGGGKALGFHPEPARRRVQGAELARAEKLVGKPGRQNYALFRAQARLDHTDGVLALAVHRLELVTATGEGEGFRGESFRRHRDGGLQRTVEMLPMLDALRQCRPGRRSPGLCARCAAVVTAQ
jgi:hypothetical protein